MDGQKKPNERLILVVDDDVDNLNLISKTLQFQGYSTAEADSGEAALEKLKSITPDLILLDINMSGISGLDTLRHVRQMENYVSVIFITARSESQDIILGLDTGADDYICKPFDPYVMLARVRAQLRTKDLKDELDNANKRLKELIDIDDLTGLYNMRSIYERLDKEIYRARRYNRAVCAVMMDMDNFKSVNDTHDHLFGSFVLQQIGGMIHTTIRKVDFAARYGGDEFLIVLTEADAVGAKSFSERLRKQIASTLYEKDGASMHLTASMGIGCVTGVVGEPVGEIIDARGLVRQADNALYEAKRAGKNCVRVFGTEQIIKRTGSK